MSPRKIGVTELVLRDAHQSLLATRMAMEDMVDACADIDAAGFWSVECWGGATFDSCIRFLNEDPWERLRTFRKLLPNSRLQMLLRGQNLLGYRHYNDEVVDKFVEKSAENGMDVFRVFDALNDPRNLEHAMAAVKKTGKHAQGTICYTTSPIHTPESFVKQADRLIDMGADSIAFKDMAALLKPQPAYDIIKGIKENHPDVQINLHCHSTTGVTLVTLQKAIEAGVDVVDTAISSMSLGPGHNPTESLVEMLEGTEYTTGLDMDRLLKIRDHFKKVRPKYKKFESKTLVNTNIFQSQIPGGMLSNMESQLEAQGAGDRMDEVMKEGRARCQPSTSAHSSETKLRVDSTWMWATARPKLVRSALVAMASRSATTPLTSGAISASIRLHRVRTVTKGRNDASVASRESVMTSAVRCDSVIALLRVRAVRPALDERSLSPSKVSSQVSTNCRARLTWLDSCPKVVSSTMPRQARCCRRRTDTS